MNFLANPIFLKHSSTPCLSGLDPPGVSGLRFAWLNEAACHLYAVSRAVGDIVLDWA